MLSTLHQWFAFAHLSRPHLTGYLPPFPQRSPPRLLTVAACGGLKPAPDGRLRGTFPHLLRSSAPPLLSVRSWHTVIGIPQDDHVTGSFTLSPAIGPEIEHVVKVDV